MRRNNVLVEILTVETYSRHASVDAHSESQVLESTTPIDGGIFCGTVPAAEGRGLKHKLIIASNTMNALCICTVTLGNTPQVSIGPSHGTKLNPRDCQWFFLSVAIAKFREMATRQMDLPHARTPSLSHLRQLTTAFHHPSTFSCGRRSFKSFRDILHTPATIFRLCDLPSFSGYGPNATSPAILSAQLLALCARAHFHHKSMLTEVQRGTFMILYESAIKDSKPWVPLVVVVDQIKKAFEESPEVNIFKFAFITSLSAIADTAGDALHTANTKLATNICTRFSDLFLDN
ncbi:hypothetical protein BCR43DRAFT_364951 [Syncephalastrum racemosum]|uniref:Uncharacterized protein n=1 Tax=Syncephalastrum racemosum TaxID=13706 RepID=A0A1X2H3X0_SYNRA|nr:hypothetical protein BCR43DRAFT_364951 [Syncephalastrum racemosum]